MVRVGTVSTGWVCGGEFTEVGGVLVKGPCGAGLIGQSHILNVHMDRVTTRLEGRSRGRAELESVVLVEVDAGRDEFVHVRRLNLALAPALHRVVPPRAAPPVVIDEEEYDVGLGGVPSALRRTHEQQQQRRQEHHERHRISQNLV